MSAVDIRGHVDIDVDGEHARLDGEGDGVVVTSASPTSFLAEVFRARRTLGLDGLAGMPTGVELRSDRGRVLRYREGTGIAGWAVRRPDTLLAGWIRSRMRT